MYRTRIAWIRTRGSLLILTLVLIGLAHWHFAQETRGQTKTKSKAAPRAAGEADLAADIDEAIRVVEAGEFQKFLERYAPVEVLRKMRQEDMLDQAAAIMARQPQNQAQLLAVLRALQEKTPRYDKSRGLAVIDFDPFASGVPEAADELHLPTTAELKLTGLGDDLPKALAQAIKLLEAGDMAAFVERLFPPGEVARLRQGEQLTALLQQFKDTPELQTAMLADFKRMQGVKAELADKGEVAIFKLAAEKTQPARTVKLQKSGGDWRLIDAAPRVSAEFVRQAKLKPRGGVTTVQMELIGGNWRFVELPMLRAGPN